MTATTTLSALFFTSATMCGALAVAWRCFGRPRHVRTWAIAFGLAAMQSLVNALAVAAGRPAPLMLIAFALVVMPSPLVAIGARQRAALPARRQRFAVAVAAALLVVAIGVVVPVLRPAGFGSTMLFSAACLALAARHIRPATGRAEPAERVMHLALLLLAVAEALLGVLIVLALTWPAVTLFARLYTVALAIALPVTSLCAGVSALLLVASDLAVELGWQAARDPLTGVFNRRGFQDGATRALAGARRLRIPATLVLADIDHFKAINDRHGHAAGDRTLCFIARQLQDGVRQGDLVARIGGEEFALLLFDSTAAQSVEIVERIRIAIAQGFADDGAPVPVTVSFGIGTVAYQDAPLDALLAAALARADRALYLAKVGGRNRATVAE